MDLFHTYIFNDKMLGRIELVKVVILFFIPLREKNSCAIYLEGIFLFPSTFRAYIYFFLFFLAPYSAIYLEGELSFHEAFLLSFPRGFISFPIAEMNILRFWGIEVLIDVRDYIGIR